MDFYVKAFVIGVVDDAVLMGFVHDGFDGDAIVALQPLEFFERDATAFCAQSCEEHGGGEEHLAGEGVAEVFFFGALCEVEEQVGQLVEEGEAFAFG